MDLIRTLTAEAAVNLATGTLGLHIGQHIGPREKRGHRDFLLTEGETSKDQITTSTTTQAGIIQSDLIEISDDPYSEISCEIK